MIAMNPMNTLGNSPIKAQSQRADNLYQKDTAQEDRSDYEQALSRVSSADESQPKEPASSVKDAGATAKTEQENEPASADNPETAEEIQSGGVSSAACAAQRAMTGEQGAKQASQHLAGKVSSSAHHQAQPYSLMQLLKHQTKGAEGTAQAQGTPLAQAEAKSAMVKSAVVSAGGDAASASDSAAAVKAAMALTSSTTVKNSMPLTLEGALANAHNTHNLDVASLRVEQQVGDVSAIDRHLSQPASAKYEWSPLKLDSQQQSWSRQLCNVLQDRIEMQINQHIKQAKIRLDPPELGRLDLTVRFDGDRLSVMVQSSNASVREALQDSLANLRGGLADQFGGGVDVNVGGDSLPKQFKESENNVALHSVEEQETIEHLPASTSGWVNALA